MAGAIALFSSLSLAPLAAGESPAGDVAVPWPATINEYTYDTGAIISDTQDNNPGYSDLWAGASDDLSTVFFDSDGTNIFLRMRVRQDPDKSGGLESTNYLVSIAVGGVQAAVVGLNGKPASVDFVYTANADASIIREVYTTPFTNDGSGTSAGARWYAAPDEGYFLDFQVPIAAITAVAPSVTPSSPIQLFFGSSQAANLSVINKDYMIGTNVSYVGLEVVTLSGAPAATPPTANDDSASVLEDDSVVVDLADNDDDAGGDLDPTSLVVTVGPTNGSVVNHGDGTVTYTPDPGFNGSDSLDYVICDLAGECDTATLTITVDPVNDDPVAVDDVVTTPEDSLVTIDVVANDSDPDGDPMTVPIYDAVSANGGTVACTLAGSCTYDPAPDYSGPDSFTYTIDDGAGGVDTATVLITVVGVNDGPLAVDDAVTIPEDTASTDILVLTNDLDPEFDTLAIDFYTQPAVGSVTEVGAVLRYVPPADWAGTDTFTYRVCDNGLPPLCDEAEVVVTVTPVNDPVAGGDDSVVTLEDVDAVIPMTTLLANDADVDGPGPLVITGVTNGTNGTVSIVGGDVVYDPALNFNGSDTFTYTVCDSAASPGCDTVSVTVNVGGVNDPPIADDEAVSTTEDIDAVIPLATLLAGDTDIDGPGPLVITAVTDGANGTASIVGSDVVYSPNPDFNGSDAFTYRVCDSGIPPACDVAIVGIGVLAANDPPTAKDDTITTDEDTPATVAVLGNDSDVDPLDVLTVTNIATPPASGVAFVNPDYTITYTPAPDFFGNDEFEYEISDGTTTTTAWVRFVTVNPVNDAPEATADTASVPEDGSVVVPVLDSVDDVDDTVLTVTTAGPASNGTVVVNPDNTVSYTPDPDFFGSDSFSYTVCDPGGLCDTETVVVTVGAVNDDPSAGDDIAIVSEDGTTTIAVMANDSDPDGDLISVTSAGPASNGTVTVNLDGTVTYVPDPDFSGSDSFTYVVDDGFGGMTTATVSVSVTAVNDAPSAIPADLDVTEDGTATIDVLVGAVDPDADPLAVTSAGPASNGTVTVNPDGTVTYVPDPDFSGTDVFTFTIDDGNGGVTGSTVTVTVAPVNDAPVPVADTLAVTEDLAATIDLLANDSDVDGDALHIGALTQGSNGMVLLNADGTVTYIPNADFNGSDSFEYQVCDGSAVCAWATVSVAVAAVNDAPDYAGDAAVASVPGTTPPPLDFFEPDGEAFTVSVQSGQLPAGLTLNADGTWLGVAATAGAYPLTLEVCDALGACSVVSIVLSIELLPATGFDLADLLLAGLLLLVLGRLVLVGSPRLRRAGRDRDTSPARADRGERFTDSGAEPNAIRASRWPGAIWQ